MDDLKVFARFNYFFLFLGVELAEYCSTMLLDKTPDGKESKNEKYYLLSDIVPLDNQLRRDLQQERLDKVLSHQKLERDDTRYERECLFCRTVVKESRANFLSHLFEKHNFHIAKTENLVFIGDLIEMLSNKLDSCICVYCEKVFKDRNILKEHMRKKVHKRINPSNKEYDRFFVSNYLEMGKNWQSYLKACGAPKAHRSSSSVNSGKSKRSQKESSSEDDKDWSDWEEKDSISIICLFCKHSESKYDEIMSHILEKHHFDFSTLTKTLNFYEKVKIVNYIRRQVHLLRCISCDSEYQNSSDLLLHMTKDMHLKLDDSKLWNQPEFYFPTYEDDGLLFCLEDNEDSGDESNLSVKVKSNAIEPTNISEEVALSCLQD